MFYFNFPQFTQGGWVKVTFLKFQVLRERSSDFASSLEDPVYSVFKVQSVLTLVCRDEFVTASSNSMYKRLLVCTFSELLHRNSGINSYLAQPVHSILKVEQNMKLVSQFSLFTVKQSCMCKSCLFCKHQVLCERSSDIVFFLEHRYIAFSQCKVSCFQLFFLIFHCFSILHVSLIHETLGASSIKQ